MLNKKLLLLFFISGFFIGITLVINFLNQRSPQQRGIASMEQNADSFQNATFDLSTARDLELIGRLKYRIVEQLESSFNNDFVTVQLGNAKFSNFDGQLKELCEEFPNFELQFQASEVIVAGEFPTIKIQSACRFEKGAEKTKPVLIPIAKLFSLSPDTVNFQGEEAQFIFTNNDEEWPLHWELSNLKFYSTTEPETLEISSLEILKIRGESVKFDRLGDEISQ